MKSRRLLVAALAATLLAPNLLHAQAWPSKPIRLIVPYPAGGPTDQLSRRLGQQLAVSLGQPVVVENIAGGTASIGLSRLARSAADGYTIGLGANSTQSIAPHLMKLPYDPLTDFQALGGMVTFAYALVTQPGEPAKTFAELVARSKTMPGGMSYGSSGVGTGGHLVAELFRQQTGANLNHIPYSGTAPTQRDAMAGHIGFMFDVIGSALPLVSGGKLKALGVTSKTRSRAMPDVPPIADSVPGFEGLGWLAFFAPKGLPTEITQRLNAEIDKAYRTPDLAAFLDKSGYEYVAGPPEQLNETVQRDAALWGRVVKAAGIKPE